MFSELQVKALSSKLSAKYVRTRQHSGMTLSYIEGWHTIAEANRIFGYDAWDRQTVAVRCIWEGTRERQSACSYIARVRVRVRAGDSEICREGCGSGHGVGLTLGEAHESAIKEAETDAMKRALSTFGNPFGLALYDKKQQNVRGRGKKPQKTIANGQDKPIAWLLLSSEGEYLNAHDDPVDYCKAMRQLLEAISTRERLRAFWQRNLVTVAMLRQNLPDLKTEKGEHYAEILTSLYKHQMRLVREEERAYEQRARDLEERSQAQELAEIRAMQDGAEIMASSVDTAEQLPLDPEQAIDGQRNGARKSTSSEQGRRHAVQGNGLDRRERDDRGEHKAPKEPSAPSLGDNTVETQGGADGNRQIDKTNLAISTPRRIRDREHLRYVAAQPCIVCGRAPSHAHHLRFAQPRALGRKVSDEWTVPLCVTHHRALHSVGDEKSWWDDKGIDPSAHAVRLWWDTKHGGLKREHEFLADGSSVISAGQEGPKERAKQAEPEDGGRVPKLAKS